jgi:predicted membrane chloride channel (bestrophin family)
MEAPFGEAFMAIPLDAMTRGLEICVLKSLTEKDLPKPIPLKHFVLT